MEYLVILLLILTKCSFLWAGIGFSNQWILPEGRIIGGHEAKPHSYPYTVSLQTRFLWVRLHTCGGALLNERWILTAAHCIRESWLIRVLPLDAVAGTHNVNDFDPKAQVINIDKRIAHPLYKGGIGPNDIAVLRTTLPFVFTKEVQPVKLPMQNIDHKFLTLTGWGVLRTTFFIPDLPTKLQEVNVTYIPYDECYKAIEELKDDYEENPLDKNANMCTGPLSGGIAACSGDSGGPLVQFISQVNEETLDDSTTTETTEQKNDDVFEEYDDIENNISEEESIESNDRIIYEISKRSKDEEPFPVILGVVSWGVSPCGEKGAPTVYTKVSPYINFINEHINTS